MEWNLIKSIAYLIVVITIKECQTDCPLHGLGSNPGHGGVFEGKFPWLITPCKPVLSQRGRKWHQTVMRRKVHIQPHAEKPGENKIIRNQRVLRKNRKS